MNQTPIERAAEAVFRLYDRVFTLTASDIPRAVFESIDREGLARVLADHRDDYDSDCGVDYPCQCGAGEGENGRRDPEFSHVEHLADVIRAWLLGTNEGGE